MANYFPNDANIEKDITQETKFWQDIIINNFIDPLKICLNCKFIYLKLNNNINNPIIYWCSLANCRKIVGLSKNTFF